MAKLKQSLLDDDPRLYSLLVLGMLCGVLLRAACTGWGSLFCAYGMVVIIDDGSLSAIQDGLTNIVCGALLILLNTAIRLLATEFVRSTPFFEDE